MKSKRPTLITIICIIGFISLGLSAFTLARFYGMLITTFGIWFIIMLFASLLLTVGSLIGYWLMKKWGVYVYVGTFVVGTIVGILKGLPFTVLGIVVPVLISAIGFLYLRKMD